MKHSPKDGNAGRGGAIKLLICALGITLIRLRAGGDAASARPLGRKDEIERCRNDGAATRRLIDGMPQREAKLPDILRDIPGRCMRLRLESLDLDLLREGNLANDLRIALFPLSLEVVSMNNVPSSAIVFGLT